VYEESKRRESIYRYIYIILDGQEAFSVVCKIKTCDGSSCIVYSVIIAIYIYYAVPEKVNCINVVVLLSFRIRRGSRRVSSVKGIHFISAILFIRPTVYVLFMYKEYFLFFISIKLNIVPSTGINEIIQ